MTTYDERIEELLELCDTLGDCLNDIVQMSKKDTLNYFSIERTLEKYELERVFK